MTANFQPNNTLGNYLPEQVWLPEDLKTFQSEVKRLAEDHARMINRKDTGSYDEVEQVINQQFFSANTQNKRFVFRKVFQFGAIAAGAVLNIPHGITGVLTFTRIYGTITTAFPDDRPLPYTDAFLVTNQVSVLRNGLNIVIQNGATAPAVVSGVLILEYLKN